MSIYQNILLILQTLHGLIEA